jgi:membrane-anchored protein YejM (alkaline phosphatase superfamily)
VLPHRASILAALSHAGTLRQCRKVDQPIAALLHDLDARGLLDQTLVVWSGEFGRTPTSQGRHHRLTDVGGQNDLSARLIKA